MEAKSIFNLINYNNGNFKSEAQSKFFNDVACAGEITVSGGQTYKNAWNWIVTVDSVGIVDVYKNTNKNRSLFWSRETNAEYQATRAKKNMPTESDVQNIKSDIQYYDGLIAEQQAVLDKFNEIKACKEIPEFMRESVNEQYNLTSECIETYTKQRAERQVLLQKFEERLKTVLA